MLVKEFKDMLETKLPLTLDLQHFSDEGGDGEQQEDNKQEETSNQVDEKETPEDKVEDKKEIKQDATFTQEQLNAIAAKEAKKAREKVLKDLGIEDVTKGKKALEEYKKQVDAQKTDAEKALERAEALEKEKLSAMNEATSLKSQLAAMKADVKADSVEDVVLLANKYLDEDTEIDEAIVKVLEKYPHFKREEVTETKNEKGKPEFINADHKTDDKPSEQELWNKSFAFGQVKQ